MSADGLSKGDVRWLIHEIIACDVAINAGNKDRWLLSKRETLSIVTARLCRIEKGDLNLYIKWVQKEVLSRRARPGDLEEPSSWARRNHK